MKILLINPPRSPHNSIRAFAPTEALPFIHKKLIGPPLGLLTVAAAVHADHDCFLLELKGEYDAHPDSPDPATLVRRELERIRPDVVGVTVIASEFNGAAAIAHTCKEFDPAIVTVAGGLHTTLCPDDFGPTDFDYLFPGQSAYPFKDFVNALESHRPIGEIGGILINHDGTLTPTPAQPAVYDSAGDHFLLPRRELVLPWKETYRVGREQKSVTYLFSSLGCPYRCTFCSIWPQFAGRFYQRAVESIVAELKTITDYEVVRFSDANTVVNPETISRLFDRIRQEGIDKEYVMDLRADTAVSHPRLVEKMAENGLRVVICGFESFRDDELKRYRKSSQEHLIQEAIHIFHANGIQIRGNYVVPTDYTDRDFDALEAYARTHRVTYAGYTILTPMPGTPLYTEMHRSIVDTDLDKYNFFNAVTRTKLSRENFYRRIGRLWPIKKGMDVI